MIFSVWQPTVRAYDYYESRGTQMPLSGPPRASHLGKRPSLGIPPEAAAWPLPADARRVGRGAYPRGVIASPESHDGLSGFIDDVPTWGWLAAGVGALIFLGKRRRWR